VGRPVFVGPVGCSHRPVSSVRASGSRAPSARPAPLVRATRAPRPLSTKYKPAAAAKNGQTDAMTIRHPFARSPTTTPHRLTLFEPNSDTHPGQPIVDDLQPTPSANMSGPVALLIALSLVLAPTRPAPAAAATASTFDDQIQAPYYKQPSNDTKIIQQQQHDRQELDLATTYDVHCTQAPAALQAACSSLNWAPQTRFPNLLNHRSVFELNAELAAPDTRHLLEALASDRVECKLSEQFKLLLCSNLSPVCLDILVGPCRQTCLRTRTSCRPALQRLGLEWPKFLDCRRFPSSVNEQCLSRQPPSLVVPTRTLLGASSATAEPATSNGTASVAPRRPPSSTKRRRKDKKAGRRSTTRSPISNAADHEHSSSATTTPPSTWATQETARNDSNPDSHTATATMATISDFTSTKADDLSTTITATALTTTTTTAPPTAAATTTTIEQAVTTNSPASATPEPVNDLTPKADLSDPRVGPAGERADAPESGPANANMPTISGRDLVETLCRANPDWLIKTKLTDSQLVGAVKKRKFKVRSFRQIFGSFGNRSSSSTTSTQASQPQEQPLNGGGSARPATATGRSIVLPSVALSLSNSSTLIYPAGPNLLLQPMNDSNPIGQTSDGDSPSANRSSSSSSSSPPPLTSRTFLVLGNELAEPKAAGAPTRTVTHIVMWPGAKAAKDGDSPAAASIVNTYRDFKLRGASLCRMFVSPSSSSSSPLLVQQALSTQPDSSTAPTTAELSTTVAIPTARPSSTPRTRKQQRKHHRHGLAQDKP
jgi:hypothetical protein